MIVPTADRNTLTPLLIFQADALVPAAYLFRNRVLDLTLGHQVAYGTVDVLCITGIAEGDGQLPHGCGSNVPEEDHDIVPEFICGPTNLDLCNIPHFSVFQKLYVDGERDSEERPLRVRFERSHL